MYYFVDHHDGVARSIRLDGRSRLVHDRRESSSAFDREALLSPGYDWLPLNQRQLPVVGENLFENYDLLLCHD